MNSSGWHELEEELATCIQRSLIDPIAAKFEQLDGQQRAHYRQHRADSKGNAEAIAKLQRLVDRLRSAIVLLIILQVFSLIALFSR